MIKNRILLVLSIPPPIHGASMMGKYILENEVINTTFETKYLNLNTSKSIEDMGKSGLPKLLNYLTLLKNVLHSFWSFKPDLCYITLNTKWIGFYKDFGVVLLCKLFNVPCLYHFHNKGVSGRQDNLIDNLLYNFTFNGSRVILLSEYLYYDVQKYYSKAEVFFCPNGIPDENPSGKLTKNKTPKKILFLSNLIESKGVFILLNAICLLKERNLKFELILAGGEGDITAQQLEKKITELDLTHEVSYVGRVYGESKTQLFQEADLFAFPSFYPNECFPLVLLEAMSYGLPCVTTAEGGIRSIIEHGREGLIVAKKDERELANALENLLINPEYTLDLGRNARQKFEEQFTLDRFASRMNKIFLESIPLRS